MICTKRTRRDSNPHLEDLQSSALSSLATCSYAERKGIEPQPRFRELAFQASAANQYLPTLRSFSVKSCAENKGIEPSPRFRELA